MGVISSVDPSSSFPSDPAAASVSTIVAPFSSSILGRTFDGSDNCNNEREYERVTFVEYFNIRLSDVAH